MISMDDFLLCGLYKSLSIRNGDSILEEKKTTNQIVCINCIQIYCIDLIDKTNWITEKEIINNECNITVFCPYCKMDCLIPLSKIDCKNETEKKKFLENLSEKMAFIETNDFSGILLEKNE